MTMAARHAAPRGTRHGRERTDTDTEPKAPAMSVAQVSGSALGVVSGALLASALGLFGTVAGTVIFSFTASVGGAAFHLGLHRTGRRYRSPGGSRRYRNPVRTSSGARVHDPDLTVGEQQRLAVSVGVDRRFLG